MRRSSSWLSFLLLDTAPLLAVALGVFFLLTSRVADCYPVPSDSMEPTIHGDRERGDLVLVDKTAWWFGSSPKPFDAVVIRGVRAGDNLMVKRCVAIGPAVVRIAAGDLYLADSSGVFGDPLRKDPRRHADLRVPIFRHPDPECEQVLEEVFHLPPGFGQLAGDTIALAAAGEGAADLRQLLEPAQREATDGSTAPRIPGFLATNKGVDTSYLTPAGRREWQGINYYADIGLSVRVDLPAATGLAFVLEFRQRDYALIWDAGRQRFQVVVGGRVVDERPGTLPPGAHRLVFGYLDGRLFLLVDDQEAYLAPLALDHHHAYAPGRPNGIQLGCAGTGPLRIHELTLFRDLCASPDGSRGRLGTDRFQVPADHMFLLGDNPHDSADSRGSLGTVPLDRLVGRPFAILAPAGRTRFFVR